MEADFFARGESSTSGADCKSKKANDLDVLIDAQ
jgi:hypothetical protein